jgi:hypothetical protein
MSSDDPTASPGARNRHPGEAVPGDAAGNSTPNDPTAAPPGRNRPPAAAVPGNAGDPMVARLRTALHELTTGAEPAGTRVMALASRQPRRWMLPAVAAAAVALIVGVAIAVVGRDDGSTPAALTTPAGPPVTPLPSTASTIPWYELRLDDGSTGSTPADIAPGYPLPQVWAAPDYSRVLVAMTSATPDAASQPVEWPVVEPLANPPSGVAWAFRGEDPASWHGVYWAPDDETSVILTGFGLAANELEELLPAFRIEHGDDGPHTVSTLSSLIPVVGGKGGYYIGTYGLGDSGDAVHVAQLAVSGAGAARPLSLLASGAHAIAPASTPFGEGFRVETSTGVHVWWQVDGGPFWAGIYAPTDQIDDVLGRLERVEDIPVPGPFLAPEPPAPANITPLCGTVLAAPSPHALATQAPTGSATTTTTTLSSPSVNEPAMTAVAPPSFPGEGFKPPIAVGESVMLSAVKALGERGIEVHGLEATQASGIAEQLETLRDADRFGDVVIVQVGTNGTVTVADLDRIMAAVADVERVIVLSAHADRPWIGPNNELIRALPNHYPDVVVLDWDQIAATCDCLTADGIHIEDGDVYADHIAAAAGLR